MSARASPQTLLGDPLASWLQESHFAAGGEWRAGEGRTRGGEGRGKGEWGREGKGGSWGRANSALVVGEIDAPANSPRGAYSVCYTLLFTKPQVLLVPICVRQSGVMVSDFLVFPDSTRCEPVLSLSGTIDPEQSFFCTSAGISQNSQYVRINIKQKLEQLS